MWSTADSIQALADHQVTVQPYADIHNCCNCLMSTMAVVASPLQDLYKVFKKGFHHKQMVLKDAEKEGMQMVVPWMSWVRMEVFYGCEKGWVPKGALDKYNIIPQLFQKRKKEVGIFIPLEVLAWVVTACWVLRFRLTYFWRNANISSIFYFPKSTSINAKYSSLWGTLKIMLFTKYLIKWIGIISWNFGIGLI